MARVNAKVHAEIAEETQRRKARLSDRKADPNAAVAGNYPGRVMTGLSDQKWYQELRTEHPTEDECWIWGGRPKQVTAVVAERKRHDGLPLIVSVRPYLRCVLLDEPYAPGLSARSSCAPTCVNPWHMQREDAAVQGKPVAVASDKPMLWGYLTSLVAAVWGEVRGVDNPWAMHTDVSQYPRIRSHVRRMTQATLLAIAAGDVSMDDTLSTVQAAQIIADAGFTVRIDNADEAWLAAMSDVLPVSLRVALGMV